MPKTSSLLWAGAHVSGSSAIIVLIKENSKSLSIHSDSTFKLATGDRAEAYAIMHRRIRDYISENKVTQAAIKASALSTKGVKKAHLEAAELRGVVMAALHEGGASVQQATKASLSKTVGSKDVDGYLKDDSFWGSKVTGELRIGSREAAFIVYGLTIARHEK